MSVDRALIELGHRTAAAVTGALAMFGVSDAELTGVAVGVEGSQPLDSMPMPAVATNVSYVEGVTGGNVFAITVGGARRLAAAMMGQEPGEDELGELSELEMSAVGEAMNQMMAAAANATSAVLGYEVEIGPPETLTLTHPADAHDLFENAPHMVVAGFSICGQNARLAQIVPRAFVVRIIEALDELAAEATAAQAPSEAVVTTGELPLDEALRGIGVRVWAELGRTRMSAGHVVGLSAGAVVELNREADEPIDLYVNGTRFATGRLVVADGSEWAVQIDAIVAQLS